MADEIKKQIKKIRSKIEEIDGDLGNLAEAAAQYKAKGVNPEYAKERIGKLNAEKTELEGKLQSLQDELKSLHAKKGAKKGGARRTRRTRRTRTRRSRRQ